MSVVLLQYWKERKEKKSGHICRANHNGTMTSTRLAVLDADLSCSMVCTSKRETRLSGLGDASCLLRDENRPLVLESDPQVAVCLLYDVGPQRSGHVQLVP